LRSIFLFFISLSEFEARQRVCFRVHFDPSILFFEQENGNQQAAVSFFTILRNPAQNKLRNLVQNK